MTERLYEGMFLLDANEASKGWSELEGHIDSILTRNSARLELAERWPDQRLAYDIKGVRKGTYYLTYFRAPPDRISEIRRDAQLSERILRLLVIHEDFLEQELERRREVAARRGREEPAAGAPVPLAQTAPAADPPRPSPAAEAVPAAGEAQDEEQPAPLAPPVPAEDSPIDGGDEVPRTPLIEEATLPQVEEESEGGSRESEAPEV